MMRPVEPPRAVLVRGDNVWHPGWLEAWRRDDGEWRAYVRYTIGVGMQRLEWVRSEHVTASATEPAARSQR